MIDVAAGDLGLSAQRKFDCEAWIPTQGRYRELTSTSNCTDFQTRRLDIRGRLADGTIGPVATLNGTLSRSPRTIVAILETHQQADGSVRVPRGAAALPRRARGAEAGRRDVTPTAGGRGLVALDIDGTLLKWVEGAGHDLRADRARASTTPSAGRSTPAPTSCSPAAARRTA